MRKYIKLIYEDVIEIKRGKFETKLCSSLVPFGNMNTEYIEGSEYKDNFERFIQDVMDCGFLYTTSGDVVTILQIKKILQHNPETNKQQPKKKRTRKKKSVPKKPVEKSSDRTDIDFVADKV